MFFLLFFAGFMLFVFLIIRFILAYSSKITEFAVGHKHQDAEQIISDGMVPERWIVGGLLKGRLVSRKRLKRRAIRRMEVLIRYFTHSPLVSDDDSRDMLIKSLKYIRDDWREKSSAELFPE